MHEKGCIHVGYLLVGIFVGPQVVFTIIYYILHQLVKASDDL